MEEGGKEDGRKEEGGRNEGVLKKEQASGG